MEFNGEAQLTGGGDSPTPFTQRYMSHQVNEPLVFQWDLLSILAGITKIKRVVGKIRLLYKRG